MAYINDPKDPTAPSSDTYLIHDGYVIGAKNDVITGVHIDPRYSVSTSSPNEQPSVANHDDAYFIAPQAAGIGRLTPLLVFADQSAAVGFFHQGLSIAMDGVFTSTSGSVSGLTSSEGQFETQYSTATKGGDSGGAITAQYGSGSYLIGLHNGEIKGTTTGLATFFDTRFYDAAVDHVPVGDQGVRQLAPDVILGSQPGETVRSSNRRADIITNGDDDVLGLGAGGGLINSETGENDVIFLHQAEGVANATTGSTVIISPGSKIIVGGTKDDSLVIPVDRLWGQSGGPGIASFSSATVKLDGGVFNDFANGDTAETAQWLLLPHSLGSDDAFWKSLGNYDYGASFERVNSNHDLWIYFQAYKPGDGYDSATADPTDNAIPDQVSWTGSILIKDFHEGDFGLSWTKADYPVHGADTPEDDQKQHDAYIAAETAAILAHKPAEQAQTVVLDDPNVTWDGQVVDFH